MNDIEKFNLISALNFYPQTYKTEFTYDNVKVVLNHITIYKVTRIKLYFNELQIFINGNDGFMQYALWISLDDIIEFYINDKNMLMGVEK